MVKKTLLFTVLFFGYSAFSFAQKSDHHGIDTNWCWGTIILSDGTELIGLIRNNEKARLISFKKREKDDGVESFRAVDILSLEYFDSENQVNRKFYSLVTKDKTSEDSEIFLFEILKEYDHFAILSLRDRTTKSQKQGATMPMGLGGISGSAYIPPKTDIAQIEEIYFMNEEGERELYMVIEHHDVDRSLFRYITDKGKITDTSLPERYVGEADWKKLLSYAEDADIRIVNRKNLMSVFDHYEIMIEK